MRFDVNKVLYGLGIILTINSEYYSVGNIYLHIIFNVVGIQFLFWGSEK